MSESGPGEARLRLPRVVLVAGILAAAIKIVLAARTMGTNDVRAFWFFLQEYRGSGAILLYEKDPEFNHPPFILHWLMGLRWLWAATSIPFWFLVRLPSILADFGSLWLVARLLAPRLAEPATRFELLLVALAPASIMISGFHGNNDPVMVFLVLLSVYLLEKPAPVWVAGIAMGMAVNVKVVPLVLWPAIFLWLPSWRRRLGYFGVAVATVVLASTPVIFQAPGLLAHKVLGYPSAYGLWGLSRILGAPALAPLSDFFQEGGRLILVATLIGLSLWMNLRAERPQLHRQVAVLVFAFLCVTPGFGVQYLAWLVPWIAGLGSGFGLWAALAWCFASGWFLVLVYTFWCQQLPRGIGDPNWLGAGFWNLGLPWSYADANTVEDWVGPIIPVEILCWITVVVVFVAQCREATRGPRPA